MKRLMMINSGSIIAPEIEDYSKNPITKQISDNEKLAQLLTLYFNDPVIFAEQILHVHPDSQQKNILRSFYTGRKRVTIRSGRGSGKTWLAGILIWHFLCTRYFSQVYATAASGGTVSGALWPTLGKIYEGMEPLFKDQFEFMAASIRHRQYNHTWFAMTRTARAENPSAMAGAHAKYMLYVIDEASGFTDDMFNSVFGSLTEEHNYLLMLSNPRKLSGFFFNSHKPTAVDVYDQYTMSCINSEFVTKSQIENWKKLYGERSNQFRVEVLGEFPTKDDDAIFSWDHVNEAINKEVVAEGEYVWGLDIASTGDKTILCIRRGNVIKKLKELRTKDTMKAVGMVVREFHQTLKKKKPKKIFVDAIAMGKGPFDRLKELNLPVVPAVASHKAKDKKYNWNARAEWFIEAREWFAQRNVSIPNDPEFIEQLTSIQGGAHSDGRFLVEKKDQFKKRHPNLGSPDKLDAFVMTFSKKRSSLDGNPILFV